MFPTQKICADNIYNKFKTTDYCLFVAQMQSGKTGTYIQVAQQMLLNNIVSNVVVFSGNREKNLEYKLKIGFNLILSILIRLLFGGHLCTILFLLNNLLSTFGMNLISDNLKVKLLTNFLKM